MTQYFILYFTLISAFVFSQKKENTSIGTSENLIYTVSFDMSGLMTNIARLSMQTEKVKTAKKTYLRLKCNAVTYSKWDSFFKIRDLYESYVHPQTLKPYLFKRDINEGGYQKKEKYVYNYKSKTIQVTTQRKKAPVTKKLAFDGDVVDVIATLYQIRNMDIEKATVGSSHKITLLFDQKPHSAYLKLLGKKTISTPATGPKECFKIGVSSSNKVLKGKNSNFIYLSADKNKIPVLIKFSIPAGNGIVTLSEASGLRI